MHSHSQTLAELLFGNDSRFISSPSDHHPIDSSVLRIVYGHNSKERTQQTSGERTERKI